MIPRLLLGARIRRPLLGAAALLLLFPAATGSAAPQRIVSIYLCADQLLPDIVDQNRILSLSRLVDRSDLSTVPGIARGIPRNRGGGEEILALEPDLVIAGAFTTPATKALLRRGGIPLVELSLAHDFAGIRQNIRRLATAVDATARGEALIARMDARLGAARPKNGATPSALVYRSGGHVQGKRTLAQAVMTRAGFRNHRSAEGIGRLSLEILLMDPPDAMIMGRPTPDVISRAAESLTHPALLRVLGNTPRITLPGRLWVCGLPETARAVEKLAAFHRRLTGGGHRQ
ncbi:MAG: ABC transporter substrate-binding protein [Alphaproteobacteria bacterium]|nr:ABC transporter substrate-binding protein [Alphaproteobacteria bacterium]